MKRRNRTEILALLPAGTALLLALWIYGPSQGCLESLFTLRTPNRTLSFDGAETFEVIDRDEKGHVEKRILEENEKPALLDSRFAETADFKIADKKSDTPLEWRVLTSEEHLRASNLLYHLMRAKKFYIEKYHSEEVARLEQVIIRVEFSNYFSRFSHWKHDEIDPAYNTANTIPASRPEDRVGLPSDAPIWNREIWFRPKKEIPMKDLYRALPENPLSPTIREVRKILYPMQLDQAVTKTLYETFNSNPGSSSTYKDGLVRQAGSLLLMEGAFVVMKLINRALLPKYYFLDSAMVPEIIYHEFSHVALSDSMTPTHATPVVEGMADYFAATIAGSPKLAQKIKEYSTGIGKDGSKRKAFLLEFESNRKATSDFVLGMLWGMRDVIGVSKTDELVWKMRTLLKTYDADIRNSLIGAAIKTCQGYKDSSGAIHAPICMNPRYDTLSLLQYFNSLGI